MLEMIWYGILSFMAVTYILADGLIIGTGIIFPFTEKKFKKREDELDSIIQVWDINKVLFVGAGSVLFFAFPLLYSTVLGSLYLLVILILWVQILSVITFALRKQFDNKLWQGFWEGVFFISNVALAFSLGVFIADIFRGIALGDNLSAVLPFWSDFFSVNGEGILDYYTFISGITAIVLLSLYALIFHKWKSKQSLFINGAVGKVFLWVITILLVASTVVLGILLDTKFPDYILQSWWGITLLSATGAFFLLGAFLSFYKQTMGLSFISMMITITLLLLMSVVSHLPVVLMNTLDTGSSLTVFNSANDTKDLITGFFWYIPVAIIYWALFIYTYKLHFFDKNEKEETY